MKKLFFIAVLSLFLVGGINFAFSHSIQEEAQGKTTWQKLQSKELDCGKLSEDDFHNLGEYFMDLMMAESHEAMNNMMIQMMGKQDEEQMHIAMGKRMSGCGVLAEFPQGGWTSMMQGMGKGMMGGGGMMGNFGWGPMGFGFRFFGWTLMIFWWVLIILGILGIIALIRRLLK